MAKDTIDYQKRWGQIYNEEAFYIWLNQFEILIHQIQISIEFPLNYETQFNQPIKYDT